MSEQPKVIIRCLVYNHEPYLRDCLEGFVMQKTNFPFKAVVHDDCSTDGCAAIIREYAEKYPHIIEPIYETENQYSKRDGSLRRVMDAATLGRSPYIAYCEGDDYWIDPLKLQKQVDYMDAHPECSMTCTNAKFYTPNGFISEKEKNSKFGQQPELDGYLNTKDIIEMGGGYLNTSTLLLRTNIKENLPIAATRFLVGDYIIQVFAALNGSVYYFHENTSVYRWGHIGSWSERTRNSPRIYNINDYIRNAEALTVLDRYSDFRYRMYFCNYLSRSIILFLNRFRNKRESILKDLGLYIRYDYVTEYEHPNYRGRISRYFFYLKRLIVRPYYPYRGVYRAVLPVYHPVCIIIVIKMGVITLINYVNRYIRKIVKLGTFMRYLI